MKPKLFLLVSGALLTSIFALAIIGRASIHTGPLDISDYYVNNTVEAGLWNPELDNPSLPRIIDPQEIIQSSTLIVTGRFNGERYGMRRCFLSKFQIQSVIKGDASISGQSINVYELCDFTMVDQSVFSYAVCYWPMISGEEYLLLLKQAPAMELETADQIPDGYILTSNSLLSRYPLMSTPNPFIYTDWEERPTMNQLKGYSSISTDHESAEKYWESTKKMFSLLNYVP